MSTPLLQVDRVCKEFGTGHTLVCAVADATFTTERGEVTLIMGPSGSGKTTLLSMIGAILRPTSGTITIDGARDHDPPPSANCHACGASSWGFVFQTFNLLESLSSPRECRDRAQHRRREGPLRDATSARILLCEAGLEARLHFNARALSAGERQRVALARALANGPTPPAR